MSLAPVIEVDKISKKYRLGNIGFNTFWEDLKRFGNTFGLPFSSKPKNFLQP